MYPGEWGGLRTGAGRKAADLRARIQVMLTPDEYCRFKALADSQGLKVSALARQIIREWLAARS